MKLIIVFLAVASILGSLGSQFAFARTSYHRLSYYPKNQKKDIFWWLGWVCAVVTSASVAAFAFIFDIDKEHSFALIFAAISALILLTKARIKKHEKNGQETVTILAGVMICCSILCEAVYFISAMYPNVKNFIANL